MNPSTPDPSEAPTPLGLHRDPTAEELVLAVREFLTDRVMAETSGALSFHARVAANVLGIVARELAGGPTNERAHRQRLARLGVTDDRALATAIRRGEVDDRWSEVVATVRRSVDDKIAVDNPRWATD